MVQFPCFLRGFCRGLALSPQSLEFLVSDLLPAGNTKKRYQKVNLGFRTHTSSEPRRDFFHQALKQHFSTQRKLLNEEMTDLYFGVGILNPKMSKNYKSDKSPYSSFFSVTIGFISINVPINSLSTVEGSMSFKFSTFAHSSTEIS